MRMNVVNHHISLSLIGVVGITILAGCGTGLTREAIGEPHIEQVIREHVPTGAPTLSLIAHDDQLGWTIFVTQPHTETRVIQKTQEWVTKRYVWFPPSIVLGLIQCPIGLLFSTMTSDMLGTDARDYGCQRLLMREPVEGTVRTTTQEDTREETVEIIEPLHGGDLVYGWPNTSLPSIRINLNNQGQASLRLSHVLGPLSQDEMTKIIMNGDEPLVKISQAGTLMVTQTLPVKQKQLHATQRQAGTPLPTERFPSRMVLMMKGSDPALLASLEDWALRRGWCLTAGSARQTMIVDELREQYSGRVADGELVSLGKWVPPTTMLEATLHHDKEGRRLTIRVTDLTAGEPLGTVTASGALEGWRRLVTQTTMDLEHLFKHAPRGCS